MDKLTALILNSRMHISFLFYLIANSFNQRFGLNADYLVLSISFWHFSIYLFDRAYDIKLDTEYQSNEVFSFSTQKKLYLVVFLLLFSSLIFFFLSDKPLFYWLIIFPFTFIYTKPVFSIKVKQILFVKNFFSAAIIWTLPIILLLKLTTNFSLLDSLKLTSSLFLLVMVIEAFWDIRDIEGDIVNHVKTIPNYFGIIFTKLYCLALLIIAAFSNGSFYLSFSIGLMLIFVYFVNKESPKIIYHLPIFILILDYLT